ncbi:MAG TPA: hypothetical protein VG733_08070 [Chthoniobacteraceae bacterium]|nr:hypothetical protein [Chthoniobacteraceae bacterium]
MAQFPFTDLHSFKDYVGFVKLCSPDEFPFRDGASPEEQWTLDLAFKGLRFGLALSVKEKGERPAFEECRRLVEDAYKHYRDGDKRQGFFALEEVCKLLRKIPSH